MVVAAAPAAPRPVVVVLIGLPGAGKSAVAHALAARLGLRRICRDEIRQAMFPECSYSFAEKSAAFRTLMLALEINCLMCESTVIDGVRFSRRSDFEHADAAIRGHGFTTIPILLACPPDAARTGVAEDVEHDRHPARNRGPELVYPVHARFDPPPANAVVIDASLPSAQVCRMAVEAVAKVRGQSAIADSGS